MPWKLSEVAKILQATKEEVKTWAHSFAENLSEEASTPEGGERCFEDVDVMALAYVQYHWEEEPDFEDIRFGLNSRSHLQEPFCQVIEFQKPFFENPPEWLNGDCTFGSLLGGMSTSDEDFTMTWMAESYKRAADALVELVVDKPMHDGHELVFPILYLYRHALELYLKIKVRPEKLNHRLEPLAEEFERLVRQSNRRIPPEVMDRLRELSAMDPDSFAFRYATSKKGESNIKTEEVWVNLAYVRDFMSVMIGSIKKHGSHQIQRNGANHEGDD